MEPTSENALERALIAAASDPGKRPEFFRLLLESDLYLLGSANRGPEPFVADEDTRVTVRDCEFRGRRVIPIFSSLARVHELVGPEEPSLRLQGRALFESLKASQLPLALNPASSFGKEFTVEEVRSLAEGNLPGSSGRAHLQLRGRYFIGQPARYPEKLTAALCTYFRDRPQVRAAYLAWVHVPESGDPPHLLIAIDAEGDFDAYVREASFVAREVLAPREIVDFFSIHGDTDAKSRAMLRHCESFYVRDRGESG